MKRIFEGDYNYRTLFSHFWIYGVCPKIAPIDLTNSRGGFDHCGVVSFKIEIFIKVRIAAGRVRAGALVAIHPSKAAS
jgi:hypothetical protein